MGECEGKEGVAACQFVCQWQFGRENEHYLSLLTCMGDNQCLSMDPDGICFGTAEESDQTITTIDQVTQELKMARWCSQCSRKVLVSISTSLQSF